MKSKEIQDNEWYHKRCEKYLQEIADLKESYKLQLKQFIKSYEEKIKRFIERLKEKITFHNKLQRNEKHWLIREIDKLSKEEFGDEFKPSPLESMEAKDKWWNNYKKEEFGEEK